MFKDWDPLRQSRNSEAPLDPYDLSDLRHPDRALPEMAQRVLHETYLTWARTGTKGENALLRGRGNFTFDDVKLFAAMEAQLALEVGDAFQCGGLVLDAPNVHVRFLHPLVAVSQERRERHIYVEILTDASESVLAFDRTAQAFRAGPVALHAYCPDDSKPGELVKRALVSRSAFCEGLSSIGEDLVAKRTGHFGASWAWRWALSDACDGVKKLLRANTEKKPRESADGSPQRIFCQKLRFARTGDDTARIDAQLNDIQCAVLLDYDSRWQHPNIFTSLASPEASG